MIINKKKSFFNVLFIKKMKKQKKIMFRPDNLMDIG